MFIVTRYNINQSGTETHSQQKYDTQTAAMKRFYSILASDIDSANYQYELVQVVRMADGIMVASQVFDNRPQPEPAPEQE